MTEEKTKYRAMGEALFQGVKDNIGRIEKSLERLTDNLDEDVPEIKAGQMPEYVEALNAISRYEMAIGTKIDELNKKAGYIEYYNK